MYLTSREQTELNFALSSVGLTASYLKHASVGSSSDQSPPQIPDHVQYREKVRRGEDIEHARQQIEELSQVLIESSVNNPTGTNRDPLSEGTADIRDMQVSTQTRQDTVTKKALQEMLPVGIFPKNRLSIS